MNADDIKNFSDVCHHVNDLSKGKLMGGSDLVMSLIVTMAMQQAYLRGRWIQDGRDPEKKNWSIVQWENNGIPATPEDLKEAEEGMHEIAVTAVLATMLRK